ncbi:MAG: ankyrin repeat domain-containing protein [Candidatus Chromulinivorax sp.]|nr:ankyrin repeat domain-containing protein [Candidatus Chromulinivorax sp.]
MKMFKNIMLIMFFAVSNTIATQGNFDDERDLLSVIDSQDELMIKDVLQTVDVNDTYYKGNTPLHYAIGDGQVSIVKILVEAGADVNAQNDYGCTPLFEVFASLLESILMIYIDGMQDAVPEDYYQEYILMAEYLVQSGADLTITYNYDGIEGIRDLHQTLPETIICAKTALCDKIQVSDSDNEKDCARKIISYLDKLQAVLI